MIQRFRLVVVDEIHRPRSDRIGNEPPALAVFVFWKNQLITVTLWRRSAPDAVGEIIPRVVGAEKTGEFVKAIFSRRGRTRVTQPPGADESRAVAPLLEQRSEGDGLGGKRLIEARVQVARFHSRQQRRARRRILGTARVKAREADAFSGEPVEIRSFDLRLAVTAQIAIAEIVGQDEDDARTTRCRWRHFYRRVRLRRQ